MLDDILKVFPWTCSTIWNFDKCLAWYFKDTQGFNDFLYGVALTNSSFLSFLNFAPISNGVTTTLQLLILNLFKMSWAYFIWCKNNHSLVALNFIPNKYDKFPRSGISNSCINFDLTSFISTSYAPVINKSSTYKHMMTPLSLLAFLTYISCSKTHFENPALIRKLYILLSQALEASFKP